MALTTDDILAIQQVVSLVHHAVDHHDQSMFEDVFTTDAIFDGRLCGGPRIEGIEAIKEFFAMGKPPHPPVHQTTNIVVYEKDGETRVKMKWICPADFTGTSFFGGDNNDVVVKTANGWRVKERVASQRFPKLATPA